MTFTSIDEAMVECRRRGYRVNFLMQITQDKWRLSLRIKDDHIWRDGASALVAVNNVFTVLDEIKRNPIPRHLRRPEDIV